MGAAQSSRDVFKGLFERRSCHRYAMEENPYLPTAPGREEANEEAAVAYVVLNLGPLERDVDAVRNHLQAICYFRKVTEGGSL